MPGIMDYSGLNIKLRIYQAMCRVAGRFEAAAADFAVVSPPRVRCRRVLSIDFSGLCG
jgi:hypothetical protein